MKKETYHHGDLRAALINAAEKVLEEKGLEGFSLRAVAREVGVSHAAPAHHFKDASGLLMALATDGFRRFTSVMEARQTRAATDPKSQMMASGHGYLDFALSHPALFRLMFGSERLKNHTEDLGEASEAAFDHLHRTVAALKGVETPDIADVLGIWSIVHGFAELYISGRLYPVQQMSKRERDDFLERIFAPVLA
ncbi:MAG: TetR/AcrR family transcriptional regulator [Pseudomonadota bacterium]